MIMFADLSRSMKDAIGTVDCFRDEMKEHVKNLGRIFRLKELKEGRITRSPTRNEKNFEDESEK